MTWQRFGYVCRKASVTLNTQEAFADGINRIENEPGSNLYGDSIHQDSLSRKILDDIAANPNRDDAKKALGIYSKMDVSLYIYEPMQFKRVTIYLTYVTFVFFVLSAIYQLMVVPSFLQAFETFELSIPSHVMFYRDYWHYFVFIVFVLLALSLVIGFTLRGLFKFRLGRENSFVLKFFAFRGIRSSYLKIINVLLYPASPGSRITSQSNIINTHLLEIDNNKMDLAVEMQAILKAEGVKLLSLCERQMRFISVAVALIIVAAIFLFLVSAYSPIFILGETV